MQNPTLSPKQKKEDLYERYIAKALPACIVFICFLVLRNFVNRQLQAIWVEKILAGFKPTAYFDVFLLIVSSAIIYHNHKRKLKTTGYLGIIFYCWYRFFDNYWSFNPMFNRSFFNNVGLCYIDLLGAYFLFPAFYRLYHQLKKATPQEKFEDGFLYTDLPINKESGKTNASMLDLDKAGLNRNKFASQIAQVIIQMRPYEAFAIGICGPWGSGKTSLMSLITANIEELDEKNKFSFIQFSPWFFENSVALITSFFAEFEKKFKSNEPLAAMLKSYGKGIAMVEKSVFSSEISDLFFKEEKSLGERYADIKEEIRKEGKLLVVTIDDLDRMDTKEIVQVFRLIRLVADFPNTFYIVGYDKNYITSSIKKELTEHNAAGYTDKIFNIEFKIPEVSFETISERLRLALEEQIKRLGTKAGKINDAELKESYQYHELIKFLKTERDIKRFCNNLMIRYLSLKEEINFYHMFLLELIYFKNNNIFSAIYESRSQIFTAYATMMAKKSDGDTLNFKELVAVDLPQPVKNILLLLFKKNSSNWRYSIANEQYFNRYFSLSLLSTDFTSEEFNVAFESSLDKLQQQLVIFNTTNSSLLREKLNDRFSSSQVAGKHSFSGTIDALLYLYNEVYYSRDLHSLQNGLNGNNLAGLIFNLILGEKRNPSFFDQRLLSFDLKNYTAFSYLASQHILNMFVARLDDESYRNWQLALRATQVELLSRSIQNSGGELHEGVLEQLKYIAGFVNKDNDGNYIEDDYQWYKANIIDTYKDFIVSNINAIAKYIRRESESNNIYNKTIGIELLKISFPVLTAS